MINPESFDLIVLDSYNITAEFFGGILNKCKVAVFDDNGDREWLINAHAVINGNIFASNLKYNNLESSTLYLLGLDYLIMDTRYRRCKDDSKVSDRIVVTTGGGDSLDLLTFFSDFFIKRGLRASLVVGPFVSHKKVRDLEIRTKNSTVDLMISPESLFPIINDAGVLITACGSTVYEALCMKRRIIPFYFASNQKNTYDELINMGYCGIGDLSLLKADEICRNLKNALMSLDKKQKLINIDGYGAQRIVDTFIRNKLL